MAYALRTRNIIFIVKLVGSDFLQYGNICGSADSFETVLLLKLLGSVMLYTAGGCSICAVYVRSKDYASCMT